MRDEQQTQQRRRSRSLRTRPILRALVWLALMSGPASAADLAGLSAARQAYVDHFRSSGQQQPREAARLEAQLQRLTANAEGETLARGLWELGTVQRFSGRFAEAIDSYQRAVQAATAAGAGDTAFDAWIGIARAHIYGTADHGAAARAFASAEAAAGDQPSAKQRYELADYAAQLLTSRGELEAGLISALRAIRFAGGDDERFYARLDAGDALQKFAERCDYRKLVDAQSADEVADGGDGWGACRRAVAAAKSHYAEARQIAGRLGWDFLAAQAQGFLDRLEPRLFLIEQRASFEKQTTSGLFNATSGDDVLVNDDFSAGASGLDEYSELAGLIDQVAGDGESRDPRTLYLRGLSADVRGEQRAALGFFREAADELQRERASLFDLRGRGTVVENRPELVRDLGLRLLALGQPEAAFAAFESIRAAGLGRLSAAFAGNDFSAAERGWLSRLVEIEARESALLTDLVETTIAGIEFDLDSAVDQLDALRARRAELRADGRFAGTLETLAKADYHPATLAELRAAVRESGIATLLYWATPTNVLLWVISPAGETVKTVFLPEPALLDKVGRLSESARSPDRDFDVTAARELYSYLLAPFEQLLGEQILIVPQGPLVTLPFEALIEPSGRYLIQQRAVSYAPSASFAARMLRSQPRAVAEVGALFDASIEADTGEVAGLEKRGGLQVTRIDAARLDATAALNALGSHAHLHVLLHGEFDSFEPLLSRLKLTNPALPRAEKALSAAELLAVNWRDTRLAVFSACEGARVNLRISNEVFGLPWAPLVGGAGRVVMSRWRVQSRSNARWMEHFYRALQAGQSPALAAQRAMREMIESDGRDDPYLWAGPQVFGR